MEVIHPSCCGLDVHKETVVACVRLALGATVTREVRMFETTTSGLLLSLAWLTELGCTHVAMEATGVYWKPAATVPRRSEHFKIFTNRGIGRRPVTSCWLESPISACAVSAKPSTWAAERMLTISNQY